LFALCPYSSCQLEPAVEKLVGEPVAFGRRGLNGFGQLPPVFIALLDQAPVAGHVAPAIDVLASNLRMELEAVGSHSIAERVVGAVQRSGERDSPPRQVEAVLMKGEDGDAARQVREQRIVPRTIEEVDVVGAELGATSGDAGAERIGEKLRTEADGKARQATLHGIAKPAAGIERDVVDAETATEDDDAVKVAGG